MFKKIIFLKTNIFPYNCSFSHRFLSLMVELITYLILTYYYVKIYQQPFCSDAAQYESGRDTTYITIIKQYLMQGHDFVCDGLYQH